MSTLDKFCFGIICVLLFVMGTLCYAKFTSYSNADYFEDKYLQNVEVMAGRIESPSVIMDVDRTEFLELLSDSSVKIVFRQFGRFYLFNEDMTIAYCWDNPLQFFWESRNW